MTGFSLPYFVRDRRRGRRDAQGSHSSGGLSGSDLRIASLGAQLGAEDPTLVESLRHEVESELPSWSSLASRRRRAGLVRERFLDRGRRNADLDREEIVVVDGWVLARSEAAAAVYLDSLC